MTAFPTALKLPKKNCAIQVDLSPKILAMGDRVKNNAAAYWAMMVALQRGEEPFTSVARYKQLVLPDGKTYRPVGHAKKWFRRACRSLRALLAQPHDGTPNGHLLRVMWALTSWFKPAR